MMLKGKNLVYPVAAVSLLTIGSAYAEDVCYSVTGKATTLAMAPLKPLEQLGSLKLVADEREFKGTLHGTITNPGGYPVVLNHEIAFGSDGALFTEGDIAYPVPVDGCRLSVTETMNVVFGTGALAGFSSSNIVAVGTVNNCTGNNEFSIAGQLCFNAPLPPNGTPKNGN